MSEHKMQESLFGDIYKSGFYLDFFQVFNWGIFDGKVYTMNCDKKSALLTGLNGSGKTTLVDAFLSLLVPPRQRFYNQSAGAEKKRERGEESYVLGAFGNKRDEDLYLSRAEYLRAKENSFSVLLAVFSFADGQNPISLMQMRYFSTTGSLQRVYTITQKRLTIEEIQNAVGAFSPQNNWKKPLKEKFGSLIYDDNFASYAEKFSQMFGLRSDRALYLFSQTVGLKGVGNLNEFIRSYMFEEQDTEKSFNDLVNHYGELSQIYNKIEKSKTQIEYLKKILQAGNEYENAQKELASITADKKMLPCWYVQTALTAIKSIFQNLEARRSVTQHKIKTIKEELAQIETALDAIKSAIDKNSTAVLLKDIEYKIKINERDLDTRKQNIAQYEKLAEKISLTLPTSEKAFMENGATLPAMQKTIRAERVAIETKCDELKIQNNDAQERYDEIKKEYDSLRTRTSNIPSDNIAVRKIICAGIGCAEKELVFAGELLQVAKSESRWEAAIEKVLHNFALCILVPQERYHAVNEFVAKNNLRGRVVYFKTDERVHLKNFSEKIGSDSLLKKLQINKSHPLHDWIEAYLQDNFNYLCTDDLAEFQRADKAVTSSGLIKVKNRHEKDDRNKKIESRFYVLGWDNSKKREALFSVMHNLQNEIATRESELAQLKNKSESGLEKLQVIASLLLVSDWDSLDVKKYSTLLNENLEAKQKLSASDSELHQLETKLKNTKFEKEQKEKTHDQFIRDEENLNTRLQTLKQKENNFLKQAEDKPSLDEKIISEFVSHYKIKNNISPTDDAYLEKLERIKEDLSQQIERNELNAEKKVKQTEGSVRDAMRKFTNPNDTLKQKFPSWSSDVRDLLPEAHALSDFKTFNEKLIFDNLPACEKRFKEKFNDDVKNDIYNFKSILDDGKQLIVNGIEELNKSLMSIPYSKNPPTYLKLEKKETNDKQIKDFKGRLKAAIPDMASVFTAEQNAELEKFKQIESLINYLKGDDAVRKKVLDVRKWFVFNAIEYYSADNVQKQSYDDSAGLSGGEKAKLTYTILASALAYQFGLTDNSPRSFRLVIIDEVFSKVDADNSSYAMELFKEIGLQLILVTPMDKINIVENYVSSVHISEKLDKTSRLLYITIDQYRKALAQNKNSILPAAGDTKAYDYE